MVAIKYVGKKPIAFDNVAHSGKNWKGAGDVQEVSEAQARALLKHPDQWQLVNTDDAEAVNAPQSFTTTDETNTEVTIGEDELKKPMEKMSAVELKAYAKEKFGKDLNPRAGKKALLDQVEELQRDHDVLGL